MVKYQFGTLTEEDVVETTQETPPEDLIVEEIPQVIVGDEASPDIVDIDVDELENSEALDEDEAEETNELPHIDYIDWYEELKEDELFNSKNGPAPRLHGLRRLAKPYILRESSKVNHLIIVPREHVTTLETRNGTDDVMSKSEHIGLHNFPMASVTFEITLIDGRTFSDSADAYYPNCEELGLFPTAVASARAEARCLRKVLGIKQHAAEEIVDKDAAEELAPDDDTKCTSAQAKLIDKILSQLDISLKDLLEGITTREIYTVEELTTGEARKALRVLNDKKKEAKRKGNKKS